MKKVLLLLVDSLSARILEPALANGRFPHLRQLQEAGVWRESISIFPSITHAALSSLATGSYPKEHGILGSYWYQADANEIAYYGADPGVIWTTGIGNFYEDFLLRLNHERLQKATIFQHAERQGRPAACLNYLIFRGDHEHPVNTPLLMQLVPPINNVADDFISGPSTLFLGDLVQATAVSDLQYRGGPENWFGFKDASTGDVLCALAAAGALPDLTVAYFPECDYVGHSSGPEAAHHEVLAAFDAMLGRLFTACGGLEPLLADTAVVITGDHAQCPIHETDAGIPLPQLLEMFRLTPPGKLWQPDDDVIVCTNLRAAALYFREPTRAAVQTAVTALRAAAGIDHVICSAHWLDAGQEGFVLCSGKRHLTFWHGGSTPDNYGNWWGWSGDLNVVDGQIENGVIQFGDYPNAFERLAGVLESEATGQIWLSAKPGYEFSMPGVRVHHGGGSHGSLHRLDSLSPLIAAGLPSAVNLPEQPRLIDVMPLCLSILNLTEEKEV